MIRLIVIGLMVAWSLSVNATDAPLTNADVIRMLEQGIPETVILAKIRATNVEFDTSTDAVIELNKKGVSEKLLVAMLEPRSVSSEGDKNADVTSVVAGNEGSAANAELPGSRPDTLSYGTATGFVRKGVTTQWDLLNLFGGPSVMATDKDGIEVWMYDKTASTASASSERSSTQTIQSEANAMASFLGVPLLAGVRNTTESENEQSAQSGQNTSTITHNVKTITFIIKFNADKTVKDYSVRQASY